MVCHHPHIKPLMTLVQDDACFSLLTLTREGIRLMAGSRRGLHPLALPCAPALDPAVCGEPPMAPASAMRRIRAPARGVHPGSGSSGSEAGDEALAAAIRRIDGLVTSLASAERTPLVIAGNDPLLKMFWGISRNPWLLRTGIAMDALPASTATLHACAWGIIASQVAARTDDARKRYAELAGTGRASTDIATVLCALVHDRVAHAFIASDAERWGSFDAVTLQVREHHPRWPCDDDLLNLLLIHASATHAHVRVVPRAQLARRRAGGGGLPSVKPGRPGTAGSHPPTPCPAGVAMKSRPPHHHHPDGKCYRDLLAAFKPERATWADGFWLRLAAQAAVLSPEPAGPAGACHPARRRGAARSFRLVPQSRLAGPLHGRGPARPAPYPGR